MLINKILNAYVDSRNLEENLTEKKVLNKLEFTSGRYHVLREIYRNFGRISSVKWISLYLESRARPAEKHTSIIHSQHNSSRPPNYRICTTEINSKAQIR